MNASDAVALAGTQAAQMLAITPSHVTAVPCTYTCSGANPQTKARTSSVTFIPCPTRLCAAQGTSAPHQPNHAQNVTQSYAKETAAHSQRTYAHGAQAPRVSIQFRTHIPADFLRCSQVIQIR